MGGVGQRLQEVRQGKEVGPEAGGGRDCDVVGRGRRQAAAAYCPPPPIPRQGELSSM